MVGRAEATAQRRIRRWPIVLGLLVLALVALVALWDWNWFRPLVEQQASAALGRTVTLRHFDLHPGRVTEVVAEGVEVASPPGFGGDKPFADIDRLTVRIDVMAYLRHRSIVVPAIIVEHPAVEALAQRDGSNNWTFHIGGGAGSSQAPGSAAPPQIGELSIEDGHVHAVIPKLRADFALDVATRAGADGGQIVVDARGTYADQPITGHFIGGALLSLREAGNPYPIDLALANGPTHVTIKGTVQNPLNFAGADVRLSLAGPDMAALYPLTGIPIPATPPYDISGSLDYGAGRIRFDHFAGKLGSSDLAGDIDVAPKGAGDRPLVTANLESRRVDLADLGGFIGTRPGRATTPDLTPQQRAAQARADASAGFLPSTPINLPRLRAADVHLVYHGNHIEGRFIPLDRLAVALDITDGRITLHPITFAVGTGDIRGDIDLATVGDLLHARASIDVHRVDLSRIMQATHLFQGQGVIGGDAHLDSTGNSVAALLGDGNGELRLFMNGGDLSALLVDLSGLEFGNAVLSALGVPTRAKVQCMITDFVLTHGVANAKTMLLATDESNIYGSGDVNFRNQTLDMHLRTRARHFTIGSLPTPINIGGTLKNPSILPGAEGAARAGAAIGLGILLPPLALLPTIQLGLGQDNACADALKQEQK
jgi:uncharacterized protein involved in outer membrane biogenesis